MSTENYYADEKEKKFVMKARSAANANTRREGRRRGLILLHNHVSAEA